MKPADRPRYFIDPPDHSPESEEEIRSFAYIQGGVPRPGVEPLREGDIIRYQQIPLNAFSTAQVILIRSFEDSAKYGVSPLRLSDQYAIQTDQPIRRIVSMNYQTGELEDNRKWSHFHNLRDFGLVCFVKCADDSTKIKWNRLGEKAELKSFTIN